MPKIRRTRLGTVAWRRRNPDQEYRKAVELYEEFHGAGPEKLEEIEIELAHPSWLTALGELVEIVVDSPAGRSSIQFDRDRPLLCSDPDGVQLYVEGGDQTLDLEKLGVEPKPMSVIGEIHQITYRTRKDFDDFETIDYYHQMGEETGDRPVLVYDSVNRLIHIAGGAYRVEESGIVN